MLNTDHKKTTKTQSGHIGVLYIYCIQIYIHAASVKELQIPQGLSFHGNEPPSISNLRCIW